MERINDLTVKAALVIFAGLWLAVHGVKWLFDKFGEVQPGGGFVD
jgi:hypothetical protein